MLAEFIAATRAEPFVWGKNDCALWCASAVAHVTGIDPAADLRGRYASRFECRQIIMDAGGLVPLIAPRMAGFAPMTGDGVGVLRIGRQTLCGLILEGRAVMRLERGLRIADEFKILAGWSWSQ